MYIDISSAKTLFKLGFPHKIFAPGDAYGLKEQEWIVGGEIIPEKSIIIPKIVANKGIWLPSTLDLWTWLIFHVDELIVEHNANELECISIVAKVAHKSYKEERICSLTFPLSKIIIQLLTRLKKKRARTFFHTPPKIMYTLPTELIVHEHRYLFQREMLELMNHGFIIDHAHLFSETDCYWYKDKVFVFGGPLFFQKIPMLVCPVEIREKGMRVASFDDLETWLLNRVSFTIIKKKGKPYKAAVKLNQGDFWVEANSLLYTFYKLILKIFEVDPSIAACDQPEPVLLQK